MGQDVNKLVQQQGLGQGPAASSPFTLETFDDGLYESRLPREWVPRNTGAQLPHPTIHS